MKPLKNAKHEKFCQLVADGKKAFEAYQVAYPSCKNPRSASSKLSTKDTIKERVAFLQGQTETEKTLNRQEKREILAEIARDDELFPSDRLHAIKLDNAMSGDDKSEEGKQVTINILNYHEGNK